MDVKVGQQRRLSAKVVILLKVLEKSLESPLYDKEIKPVNHNRNESYIFIGITGAESPILWPPDVSNQLIRKYPGTGKA